MNIINGLLAGLACAGLIACDETISRADRKAPISLENGMPMLDACLTAKPYQMRDIKTFEGQQAEMGIVARGIGAVGPSCQVYFATKAPRPEVMRQFNQRGQFVKFIPVQGGSLALYKQLNGSRYFLTTEPKSYRGGGQFYEALVVLQNPS